VRLPLDWTEQFILFLISLVANFFSAFAGGGAGLVQLPALIFLGLPFSIALATHKVASVALGIGATARHLRERTLEPGFAAFMLVFGIPGVVLGASLVLQVPDHLARVTLGVLTIGLGVFSWRRPALGLEHTPRHRNRSGFILGGGGLFIIGVLNGSLTSGTGLFVTIWLVLWFGFDYRRAVAYTLVLVGLFWNGSGALTLGILGNIRWNWLPALLLGSVVGGYVGAHLAIVKGSRWIKSAYEAITVLVGVSLVIH
jgi:uncharacterized membrane protein YfcA